MDTTPRRFASPHQSSPRTQLLSNGNYSVMISTAGTGYSRWRDLALTRWREDRTCDPWGYFVFLRDVEQGRVWSAGYQPIGTEPGLYEAAFFEDRALITRTDGDLTTSTEILVSGEEAEVRRVSITNHGAAVRLIEVTSYCEPVLAAADADSAHPAFSKMFVLTEYLADSGALLATRRPREAQEQQLWLAHGCVCDGAEGASQFETDRARFIGRGRELRSAVSLQSEPLSNTAGTVLDPVLALRRRVRIAPGASANVDFWLAVRDSREAAQGFINTHRDAAAFERAKADAASCAQGVLGRLHVDGTQAALYQRLASQVLYADAALRADAAVLEGNRLGQPALWAHGISGDLPIVLAQVDAEDQLELVRELLKAREYWQEKRLAVDLVILAGAPNLQTLLETEVKALPSTPEDGTRRGGVFVLPDSLPPADRTLLQAAARAVFHARQGSLAAQLRRLTETTPQARPTGVIPSAGTFAPGPAPPLEFFNGIGGFAGDGREYVTTLDSGQWTPAPWTNVIANPDFGFLATTDGCGSTWSLNAQQNQLTPWCNDMVSNAPAEVIYLRDEDSGVLWSATPLPIRGSGRYVVRHGFGYTRYELEAQGIGTELLQFVPLEGSIKISRLTLVNRSAAPRRLAVTHYLDWVLGSQRSRTAFVVTELDKKTSAMLARNPWSEDFQSRVAFMDMAGRQQSCTADRGEFIGRHGSLAEPAALLTGKPLSGRTGGGLDPCGAMQTHLVLQPGATLQLTFLLGEESSAAGAAALIERYRGEDLDAALQAVTQYWARTVGALQVTTPDRALDVLLNGWLLYQTLVCRMWARTAFYQSSGAYGFRDQLQDVMALLMTRPEIAREHIVRAAGRQFVEGDVQHWWMPTSGKGVKTRISDNRIWLAYVVAEYLDVTEDFALLDTDIPFLGGGPLPPDSHETFGAPSEDGSGPLFEHCVRALNYSLGVGAHGLPLFGTGDWNDGMNRVGAAGRGESVWLAWFLYSALLRFAPIAERRGANATAANWRAHAQDLQRSLEREAWDGGWYRRGYFDDGTPLGSAESEECKIDAIAQSWAVISRAGDRARAVQAMAAVDSQLISRSEKLMKLFTPAFNLTHHDPGYIKAYPAGLRENGGQYSHAAMWTVLAFALQGDGDRAAEVFSILNPINHANSSEGVERYKVEPYVVCADVYSSPQHIGRGGWTWYTGSAGWMYRSAAEGILGVQRRGNSLSIEPCIPRAWPGFEFSYVFGASRYRITVENPSGVTRGVKGATLDGKSIGHSPCVIALIDDGREHHGVISLG